MPRAVDGMKHCPECDLTKSIGQLYKTLNNHAVDGLMYTCKECNRKRSREWRVKNRERYLANSKKYYEAHPTDPRNKRDAHYRRTYVITATEYETMLKEQCGRCFLCDSEPSAGRWKKSTRLHVDHDHKTGKVRKLLCYRCNAGMGLLGDAPELLERAADYLRRHNG